MTVTPTELPPVVYVPTVQDGPAERRELELGRSLTGGLDLYCYSSPDRMRRFYGDSPWVLLLHEQVGQVLAAHAVEQVHLDARPDRGSEPLPDPGYQRPTHRRDFPPVVFVPTADDGPAAERRVEMRRTRDGRTALLAYSTVDRLATCLGDGTPWQLLDVASLQRLHDVTPYDLLLLDVAVEEGGDD